MTDLLRCPHCRGPLTPQERTWRCASGHAFDVARQGYVNLTAGRPVHTGDTADMLDARTEVLGAGHFDHVTDAVVDACRDRLPEGAIVEVGAGTAHHLAAVRRALGDRRAVAIDASVAAARRASRADPAWTTSVVADAWQPWPLLDAVAAAVLMIFAPRNLPEAARVLVPEGRLIAVTPAPDHLAELAEPLGLLRIGEDKADRLRSQALDHLEVVGSREVRQVRTLDRGALRAMAAMGPSAHHRAPGDLAARVALLPDRVPVTIAAHLTRFRPRRQR